MSDYITPPPYRYCEVCHCELPRPTRRNKRFCSNACKQKAYRIREQMNDIVAITQSGIMTRAKYTTKCEICGEQIPQSHTGRPKRYCCQRCKQVAYRERKRATQKREVLNPDDNRIYSRVG